MSNIEFTSSQIIYQSLFRLSPSNHQKYKIVTATEDDFANHINWQHELDEMIRLIGAEGKIIIKCGNSLSHNMFSKFISTYAIIPSGIANFTYIITPFTKYLTYQ